jgi:hypothetical protein
MADTGLVTPEPGERRRREAVSLRPTPIRQSVIAQPGQEASTSRQERVCMSVPRPPIWAIPAVCRTRLC